ncbi:hypothetical protein RclHR1_00460008 [Rhizophagus clarus]|uniref:Kinase-like domain-containing protein n=1 Tax=Rhizophagus clarus TaxID=94130 RepID=A0A2Z6RZQ8_9GLOM|nr:hypothetical protein RclHR1_00460008 [Rhizophagus clarus]GES73205.1 kinase-like domain-containing protein [Rhizophagus clarus]
MGLCKPANYSELENAENKIYGVLAYLAPEILRGQDYTKASDIYSFGLRPSFNMKVPQLILDLIKRCLDANPLNRPEMKYLARTFSEWVTELKDYYDTIGKNEELVKTELIE